MVKVPVKPAGPTLGVTIAPLLMPLTSDGAPRSVRTLWFEVVGFTVNGTFWVADPLDAVRVTD